MSDVDIKEKHGIWIKCEKDSRGYSDRYKCSVCGVITQYPYIVPDIDYDYCPYCGKKMD